MKKIIHSEIPSPWTITVYTDETNHHNKNIFSKGLYQESTHSEQVRSQAEEEHFKYNAAIIGMESLILAHACHGVNIETMPYIAGIESAIKTIQNNF